MFDKKHLLDEIADLRKQRDFFMGKCERLELAILSATATTAAQEFVRQAEPSPIAETLVEQPKKQTWRGMLDRWRNMSDEEQDKLLQGEPQ